MNDFTKGLLVGALSGFGATMLLRGRGGKRCSKLAVALKAAGTVLETVSHAFER